MTLLDFLELLLPNNDLHCIVDVAPGQNQFRHLFSNDIEKLARAARALDSRGHTVYHALANFSQNKRSQTNVIALKAFWLDVDCGEGKAYADQQEGLKALVAFIKASGLPAPMVVSSGLGLHVYWPLRESLLRDVWKGYADKLKTMVRLLDFETDPSRTADSASILRPIETYNRKGEPKLVKLLREAGPFDIESIAKVLDTIAAKESKKSVNSAFNVQPVYDNTPKDANAIVAKCKQMQFFKQERGNVEEPYWYAALGILTYCGDGEELAQEWSSGHPSYSQRGTQRKFEQWRDNATGPATCERFEQQNSALCEGCPHKGKITTPLQLGVVIEELPAPKEIEEVPVPWPFQRSEKGVWYSPEDEEPQMFYETDIYPTTVAYDDAVGYQVALIKANTYKDGWIEFPIRLASMNEAKELNKVLCDNGIVLNSVKKRNMMGQYMTSYIKELQKKRRTAQLTNSMGWKADNSRFVIGPYIISNEGTEKAGMSSLVSPEVLGSYEAVGNEQLWIDATATLSSPGLEPHALALMLGLGAPIMTFTGLEALLVNLQGPTGTGKTTAQQWVNSIYGDDKVLRLIARDTQKSIYKRIGLYNNLPVTIDEITEIGPEQLKNFVLSLTSGRDMARLRQDTQERTPTRWNTIIVTSSNPSLLTRLGYASMKSEAEAMRVLEIPVAVNSVFNEGGFGATINKILDRNHGVIGRRYIEGLVAHKDQLAQMLDQKEAQLSKMIQFKPEERFWSAGIRSALVGADIAKKMGLIKFDYDHVIDWLRLRVLISREDIDENRSNIYDILAAFMNTTLDTRLSFQNSGVPNKAAIHVLGEVPRREIHIRVEYDTKKIYIDRNYFKKWLVDNDLDYYTVHYDLKKEGLLMENAPKRMCLGKNSRLSNTPQVRIWTLRMQDDEALHAVTKDSRLYTQAVGENNG